MKNHYDDPDFFQAYGQMARSQNGLPAAGEWHELENMLPNFQDKDVLDLGCGYGWHCIYAAEHGAKSVLGIDISQKMIEKAKSMTKSDKVSYEIFSIENIDDLDKQFDVVISSLAIHYVQDFNSIAQKVFKLLRSSGDFIFSVEHPIFTAQGTEDWVYKDGQIDHWPVDRYFSEGIRETNFLGHKITKYHKTITTYINDLILNGFSITKVVEPTPTLEMQASSQEMRDELRRPMMLLISAHKK